MEFEKQSGDARFAIIEGTTVTMYDVVGRVIAHHRLESGNVERLMLNLGWRRTK